jgi:hypothetical protein
MELARRFARAAKPYVVIVLAGVFFFLSVADERTDAHKPVTSQYDYNKDIFPLLRDHCGSCHVPGGSAPMSLMTYRDAAPWAESIRDELTAGRMPPWPVDPMSPPVKGGQPISARDVDMIVVWASGGTPQGDPATKLPAVTLNPEWKLGPPDLKIPMEVEHTVPSGAIEDTFDLSLRVDLTETKWVRAADLMPGNATVVRDAIISIENGPVLALWEPGSDTTATPAGTAFRLAPGSKIHLEIHYEKHFDQEQQPVSDKSTIGLYFTEPPPSGREPQSFVIERTKNASDSSGSPSLTGTLPGAVRIVALRPMLDRAYGSLDVDAVTPSGSHVPLLRLRGPRPQWFERYWLREPVELASGSQITVHASPLSDVSDEPKPSRRFQFQVVLDYVPL